MQDALPLLRGLHLLCLVSLLGTLTARCVLEPASGEGRSELVRLARASLFLAVPTMLAWLLLQASSIADATDLGGALAALPLVLLSTRFGHVLAVRLVLLAMTWPLVGRGRAWCVGGAVLAAVALALQAALGHAGAAPGGTGVALLTSESLHLIAAGAWLGGLLPLLILTRSLPPAPAAAAARNFTAIGLPAVLVLMATALVQGDAMVGGLPGLFGTEYGHVILAKLALFLVLLSLALVNRFALTARFEHGQTSRAALGFAIAVEALAGAAVVMAAALLASQEPGIHADPVWPFAFRPSMAALADPDIAQEVALALAAGAAGLLMAGVGVAWRRWRLVLLTLGLATVVLAAPSLRPLLVEAYPTSYLHSPTGFAADSIVRGAVVYAANCVGCHGPAGRGDGPQAKSLAVPAADLTEPHLWEHSDGELFWWLSHGMDNPEGGLSMPGFAGTLTENDRWSVIDYIHANNAGVALHATGAWPVPVQAPSLPLICADGGQTEMGALRGQLVQILAGLPAPPSIKRIDDYALATLHIEPPPASDHAADGCIAATPDAWPAYAILTGVAPASLAGSVILVDAAGWLRAVIHTDGETSAESAVTSLLSEIIRQPIDAPKGGLHAHH